MVECNRFRAASTALLLAFLLRPTWALAVNNWDERLEGTLPLPSGYTREVADPNSGITSVVCDTGEVALHLVDANTSVKQGRINRGNWTNVSGVTLHARFRAISGDSNNMSIQLNDGLAEGRFALRWGGGTLSITNATPDAGQPSTLSMPAGTWVEVWVKIANYRYSLYTWNGGSWVLYSVGATSPPGSGGAVYIGSSSNGGVGVMDLDFYRLETTGGHTPYDSGAPCIPPLDSPAVSALASAVVSGQSTTIAVSPSELGVIYQLRRSPGNTNVGDPVSGNGGTISLPTGPLTATTAFNVLAANGANPTCSQQLTGTQTVTVATLVSTISAARALPDGTVLQLADKLVSAATATSYWIEEDDRSGGIRLVSSALPAVGRRATVIGTLSTSAGERCVIPLSETLGAQGSAPKPIGLRASAVGGTALDSNTPGFPGATGPNNVGLLVRAWGRVTATGTGYYYIDDGSSPRDGTLAGSTPNVGIRVLSTVGGLAVNDFTRVTGVSTTFPDASSQPRPAILQVVTDCLPPNTGLAVGASANTVCSGQTTNVTVALSEVGVRYQLRNSSGNVNVGGPVFGTGGTISLPTGPLTAAATFNVLATNEATGCAAQLSTSVAVSVSPLPNDGLALGATANPINPGQSTDVTVALSQSGVSYQLRNNADNSNVGAPAAGTGATISLPTGALQSTTVFNVLATGAATGCSAQLAATKTITVNPPGSTSKVGIHSVIGPRNGFYDFLVQCSNAGHPVAVVKGVDDFGACNEAKQVNQATLTIGRVNEINGNDMQGLDYLITQGLTPQQGAAWYYGQVKPKWLQNPWIDVWECCNEWSWHYAWQADFYIAMMDLAEADGFRIGLWSASGGNPPEAFYADIARACARAKAHGNHILCLHEYAWEGLLQEEYLLHGNSVVLRYRRLYNYLATQNAVCPLVITEVGQEGGGSFVGTDLFIQDYAWYDSMLKQDSYVIGCTAWTLGNWAGANFQDALPALADYISTH